MITMAPVNYALVSGNVIVNVIVIDETGPEFPQILTRYLASHDEVVRQDSLRVLGATTPPGMHFHRPTVGAPFLPPRD